MAFLHKEDGGGGEDLNIDTHSDAPARYVSLDRVYSAAASLCVSSSNVMSKKVKARKLILKRNGEPDPPILKVYSRRPKPHNQCAGLVAKDHDDEESLQKTHKRKRMGCGELVKLGVDSTVLSELDKPRLRDCRNNCNVENGSAKKRKRKHVKNSTLSGPPDKKQWALLNLEGADPKALIGLRCQVFWPLDADWYSGKVVGYNADTFRHHVQYEDGDTENLIICKEKIRFYISKEELEKLNLKLSDDCDHNDSESMVVMAASLNDCQEFEAGDIVWAKLTGHAMWPAIIVDEAVICDRPGLNKVSGERSVPVQFFGTHDFARIRVKQMMSFLNGLLSSFHQKCRKQKFTRSIQEAKVYLSEQRLPKRMRLLQKGVNASGSDCYSTDDERWSDADEPHTKGLLSQKPERTNGESPFVTEELQVLSLGKIVNDSDHFRDDRFIWPEGYTALRKFTSSTDPNICSFYKMEVLRDPQLKDRPLFRVTLDSGEQIEGSNPSACWNKVYKRIRAIHSTSDGAEFEVQGGYLSGSDMFGFSNPDVVKLLKGLTKSKLHSEASARKGISGRNKDLTVGYRPVRVDWKDLDKCSVCHMDEEYENNLFLQCDKCRMMVHARCYGEHESVDGVLWLCNLCRPGAPESPPPCCLCPVIGGAMKPTTDGRWAHLSCAIWIPETCLSDVKRMEPIDGIERISKDRWKLLCSICGVYYGACIQCSNHSCRVAYHPLCARAAGLCVELEDEDRILLLSVDDDDTEDQCIRLLSFCKRHRQPSHERSTTDEVISRSVHKCSDYRPPLNPSGCARSEPYNHIGRRGRKEPEALSAAFLKRLFVENRPHVVAGPSHHGLSGSMLLHKRVNGLRFTSSVHNIRGSQDDPLHNILSVAEKYKYMRETFRKRLVFGKSGIHGFGIFAKHSHRAGDMVIEYTGELVRPSIADRREHQIYNSLVGAGTYMFRIDDERVIDATRAGSIAHLINHSCEPNCYSRVICVNGDNHIIIFAKRDIKRWEELTYDYRFFSIDEHLACYCGFPRCRGVVNDMEAGERLARITVRRSELVDWTGE